MDYEENIVAEGTEEFVVDADKQAKLPDNIEKMFAYMEERLASCKKAFMARFEEPEKTSVFDFDF